MTNVDIIGTRKVADILGKRFMWPNMSADIHHFCQSCLVCHRFNRKGQAKAPMIERPVVTEPFEVVAMDIVGPLPQGRGRMCYILTTICMATHWPDVVPLKVGRGIGQYFWKNGVNITASLRQRDPIYRQTC